MLFSFPSFFFFSPYRGDNCGLWKKIALRKIGNSNLLIEKRNLFLFVFECFMIIGGFSSYKFLYLAFWNKPIGQTSDISLCSNRMHSMHDYCKSAYRWSALSLYNHKLKSCSCEGFSVKSVLKMLRLELLGINTT